MVFLQIQYFYILKENTFYVNHLYLLNNYLTICEDLHLTIESRKHRDKFRLRKTTFKSNGLQPNVAGASWEKIRDLAGIHAPPTPPAAAIDQIEAWLESPTLMLLKETEGYWLQSRNIIETGRIVGGQIHDARIAALCQLHEVKELRIK